MAGNFIYLIVFIGCFYNGGEGKPTLEERKAKDNKIYYWPDGIIPYRIDNSVRDVRRTIINGINMWSGSTCLKFQELNSTIKSPHIVFKKSNGCHSSVGRTTWVNGQTVSIGSGCDTRGTVGHEIGHAIGLYHEQSRPDRDDYVVVLDKNIDVAEKYNFDIETDIETFGVPYDVTSLMHYEIDTFTINGKNTIVPKDVFKTLEVGQREKLSFYDIKLVNLMYNCNTKCDNTDKCQNGGYRSKSCFCNCPSGFYGDLCQEKFEFSISEPCKANITSPTEITTPNHPKNYPSDSKCVWLITAPQGKKVKLHFVEFDLEDRQIKSNRCLWDYVEIRTDDLYNGDKYCSKELNKSKITSSSNEAVVLFKSEFGSHTGFKLQIDFA